MQEQGLLVPDLENAEPEDEDEPVGIIDFMVEQGEEKDAAYMPDHSDGVFTIFLNISPPM